ncbi:thiolase family protein [Desulfatibacillum aliphaticivorans]|uniref:thiolase family protein n=1 Tax=Desulfatibacillum aliphaticivorans TaxID=218208 RepID=UPI00048198D8|nr:thiolase family protein [Desulfatibacillum aliphaticivorans]
MKEVYLVDGVRTAIGRMGGSLSMFRPEELAAFALKGLIEKTGIDPSIVDDVLVGHACTNNAAVNIARWAALKAGFPYSVPAQTVERQCGSALQTINSAAANIKAGFGEVYIAGGCESWSNQPYLMERQKQPFSLVPPKYITRQVGPTEETDAPMGIVAEILADEFGVSREEQDAFGLRSQTRAIQAIKEGYFKEEIVPVKVPQRKGDPIIFDQDEHPRETNPEKLAKLRPAFKKDGTVTAGTSSGLNDGAVANLVASQEKCEELSLKPLARFVSCALGAREPKYMGVAPVIAMEKALVNAGLTMADMDVVECNEAFASQTLAVMKSLKKNGHEFDEEKWNPNGGAIAFGHPNGMSGGRLALAVVHQLKRIQGRYGMATLCIGGGQGIAAIFERI